MTDEYSRSVLKVVVAQICQTIGYSSVNSTPYEFLVDLMGEYMLRIARLTHQYSETLGRTTPNLDDLGLAFKHMNIDINELADYIKNVDSVPCVKIPPKFPIHKESHLNFLKPGSDEVVTRPMHVHEHLPAMYPETEGDVKPTETVDEKNGMPAEFTCNGSNGTTNDVSPSRNLSQGQFKRPGEPVESPITKRARLMEEGRPLREIHSVMMTTSGFLSPAREGKLPEARTPQQTRSDSPPPPTSYPVVPPELKTEKKPKKVLKTPDGRKLDKENKKKNRKELFKVEKAEGKKKVKDGKSKKCKAIVPGPSGSAPVTKIPKAAGPKIPKVNQKVKQEKLAELAAALPNVEVKEETVDKLPSEPDKQKLNIFKKISKPREDKEKEMMDLHKYGKDGLPFAVDSPRPLDERLHEVDVKEERKPFTPEMHIAGDDVSEVIPQPYGFNNNSPLNMPVPKTPELNMYLMSDQKKKRKDKISKKKESKCKTPKEPGSKKAKQIPMEIPEVELLERPKTPQAPEPPLVREPVMPPTLPFPFFQNFSASPNFIPNPLFSRFPMPLGRGMPMPPHGLPIPPRFPGGPLAPPMRPEDFSMNRIKPEREKHMPIPPPLSDPELFIKEKEKVEKVKPIKYEKEMRPITPPAPIVPVAPTSFPTVPEPLMGPAPIPSMHAPIGAPLSPLKSTKLEKDKEKKIKEHKKEKKDKTKKKKDKKDKHKEKGLKIKEKKDKSEKKDKLEKIKEKKDKKEKRKEKEAKQKAVKEEKTPESVPKLTLKLGPPSPRPATPDNPLMKKITIKTVTQKREEEVKRELSPELAKISALVTRPPKPKSTSKKAEEGLIDMNPAFAPDNSFSTNLTSVSTAVPRAQKTLFKALPPREPEPPVSQYQPHIPITEPYYFDPTGRQIWICPACGRPDDGSPMVGCDDCDAWYHWVCVGMQVPPAENENWYCRICIAKKEEQHHDKKKKKRKKKMKIPA